MSEHFTKKMRERLSANRYVAKVSPEKISFTDEFRFMVAQEVATSGGDVNNIIRQTLSRIGIDPKLMGDGRIATIRTSIRGLVTKAESVEAVGDGEVDSKRLERLESQVLYMQQEMEFLKKTLLKADIT